MTENKKPKNTEEEIPLKKRMIILYIILFVIGSFFAFVQILIHFGYQPLPTLDEVLNSGKLILVLMPFSYIIFFSVYILVKHILKKRKQNQK
jgi:hypothetical protein